MRLLLDTHAFLWWIGDDPRLPAGARSAIGNGANEVFFSAVSAWEIAIKTGLGRVEVPRPLEHFVTEQVRVNGFEVLPVHLRHALAVSSLPGLHRDPFDRMLVAQGMQEGLTLVTGDPEIARYGAEVTW